MQNFIVYGTDGKIIRIGFCQDDDVQLQPQNDQEKVIAGIANIDTDYIDESKVDLYKLVQPRPTQLTTLDKKVMLADGEDVINITNAPEGLFYAVNVVTGESVVGLINGIDTFETTIKGTYKITIESFPYLDFITTIEAQ